MARSFVKWPTPFVISAGNSTSNALDMDVAEGMSALTLFAGTITDALTYTIEVSYDDGLTYKTLNDGSADVSPPAAGKAIAYANPPATHMRIKSSANVTGAGATWYMVAEVPIYN